MTPIKPTGGTFSITYRHGRSDPLAYNADAAAISEGTRVAGVRDEIITAAHKLDHAVFLACEVCNPPVREYPEFRIPLRQRWRNWRERMLYRAYNWLEGRQ